MQAGSVYEIRMLATNWDGALAADAAKSIDFVVPNQGIAAGGHVRVRVKSVAIVSVDNIGWDVILWGKDTKGVSGNVDTSFLRGKWGFVAGDAFRYTGDTNYYYYVDGNDQPYHDLDLTGELHVSLVARGGAKSAGAAGDVCVSLFVELTQGI